MDEGEELGQACSSCSVIVPAGADRSLAVGLRGAWGPTAVPPRQQKGLQRLLQRCWGKALLRLKQVRPEPVPR